MTHSSDPDIELQNLLAELLDGSLDPQGQRRLNDLLSHDLAARESYLDFCEMHAALAWEHGLVIADVSPSTTTCRGSTKHAQRGTRIAAILAALAASLLFALIGWNAEDGDVTNGGGPTPTTEGPIVAQLISRIDAVVTRNSVLWQPSAYQVGHYQVDRGLIQLQYDSGVTVFIEAPAAFDAISSEKLALHSGRISANVPPEGIGFTIETPEADIVDFGTEFSVEVGGGESEVHVFKGHVRVNLKSVSTHLQAKPIDLRTEQAIRIAEAGRQPVGIDLATDRFIRSIDEPQKGYPRMVKQLEPVAYYRMPIKERGLVCIPSEYDGIVLTGTGSRPACAPGIMGASLRTGGKSIGRGGLVTNTPPFTTGSFALACWIYATGRPEGATVVSNIQTDGAQEELGRFSLSLDQGTGTLVATVRDAMGQLIRCHDTERLSLEMWHHIAITCDGNELILYRNGIATSSIPCSPVSNSPPSRLTIGVDLDGAGLWEGRIDELALFNKSLSREQIHELYDAAYLREE